MQIINGEWYMEGTDPGDGSCVHTADELLEKIEKFGFLPLFGNEIKGFSVENMTDPACWWSGDPDKDPWEWREILARSGKVAYGKFYGNRAGYVSKKWFPYFANFRRQGYDFDSRYEDGKANYREKLLMDLFIPEGVDMWDVKPAKLEKQGCARELYSFEMKEKGGFGKGGEKDFEGVLTRLQMQSYLVVKDFRPRVNKKGEEYGWAVAVMTPPEYLWGYKFVTGQYKSEPEESFRAMEEQISEFFDAEGKTIRKILKG